jgi:hypothetical protein
VAEVGSTGFAGFAGAVPTTGDGALGMRGESEMDLGVSRTF